MLKLLLTAAEVADIKTDRHRKAFLGAVAIRRDGVLVYSRNSSLQDPDKRFPHAHAERRLMRKSGYGATVYVSRVLRDGHLALAKPCGYCMAALRAYGVEMVYYTISDTQWEGCKP